MQRSKKRKLELGKIGRVAQATSRGQHIAIARDIRKRRNKENREAWKLALEATKKRLSSRINDDKP